MTQVSPESLRSTVLPQVSSWVAGSWRTTSQTHVHHDPARPGVAVAEVHHAEPAIAVEARRAAREAFGRWRRTEPRARAAVLERVAALLEERADEVGEAVVREEGKTLPEAIGEARRAAEILRYFAGQVAYEPDGSTFAAQGEGNLLYARRVPIGVVAAITPWNFPLAIPAWKIAPALGFGNVVIWKPADLVPVSSRMLFQTFLDAGLPDGVLQLLVGRGSVIGPELVGVSEVDALTFTGSTGVGQQLVRNAAAVGQRCQMELGGKNAAVVLADADLDRAAEMITRGAFLSSGQKCTATSRVIVEDAVYDRFVERLVAGADSLTVGDPLAPGTDIGPLSSDTAADEVRAIVRRGEQEGRRATSRRPDDVPAGAFVAPTVFCDLPADSTLISDEIFGPVAVVLRAADAADALRLANESAFGLTAGVYTSSLAHALDFADGLEVGMVKINQETPGNAVHVPFGGRRDSSFGPGEQGKAAAEFFTEWKTVYMDRG